ncbi:MAG: DUF4426 domain-containing protein [Oleibacter sp.]|nr:DUF4426 domain-containing protein [Thalassolituus sp.]
MRWMSTLQMNGSRFATFIATVVFASVLSSTALAESGERKQVFGDYEVHYIGLNSSFIEESVAEAYGIPRSRSLGYMSISVLNTALGETPVPVTASMKGQIRNLIGQSREIEFREIKETNAVYYVSTFRFDKNEVYRIQLQVTPEGTSREFVVNFSQQFYEEP